MLDSKPAASTAPLVAIEGLGMSFGSNQVLRDVSVSVGSGDVLTLIGPSGSGKTTLLRCINFLERYDAGRIAIAGESVGYRFGADGSRSLLPDREIAASRAEAGMVFQSFNLFPHLTVLDNLVVAPVRVRGMALGAAKEQAMVLLRRVGLEGKADQYPATLSGGQQQRVAIARALAMKPRLLLMDEVTSALDPQLVDEVLEVIGSLAREGMTMVIATHEMHFARQVSSNVLFMAGGQDVEFGPPAQIFEAPKTAQLAAFLGRYRTSLPGRATSAPPESAAQPPTFTPQPP
jgi:polar amino acid transport system ATP-binding protein